MSSGKKNPLDSQDYYGIRILRNGTWLYQGTPITRHNMVKLFATALQKDAHGDHWLITPYERGRIDVEDAPFTAVELQVTAAGQNQALLFRTNLDEWVTAGPAHPIRIKFHAETGEPSPYIEIRKGLEALIVRSVYYELAALAVADATEEGLYGLWSDSMFFPLGKI